MEFRKLAGDVARAHIVEFSERFEGDLPRGDVAEELIIRLPPVVAAELRGDAAFLEASGLRDRLPLAGVGPDLIFALPAMRSAARSALNGQSATVRDLRNNRDVRFTAKHGRLMMNWEADGEMQEREAPVDAALLSPCAAERMEAFGQLVADAGPSGPDPVRWRPVLEAAELSDGDLDTIMEEVANAVPIRIARTANALSRGVLDLRLMVPSDLRYWEGLCGGAPGEMTQAEWLASVWQPRAAHLLTTFGAEGFRFIAAANGRPGFIDSAASPSVEVLEELAAEAQSDWGPLARLAIVEAATDHVGGDFIGQAASRLVLDLAEAEGEAALRLEVFAGLFRLLGAALLVSPCMAGQPPYWVRLCALAQADLLVGPVLAVQPDVPKLLKVMRELAPAGGHWAELLSLREEPLWRPEMASADWLRAEVLGRLTALLAHLGDVEAAERAAAATAEAGRASGYPPAGFSPGPLECAALPPGGAGSVPDLVNSVDAALQAIEGSTSVPVAWRFLDMASRHIQLDEVHLGKLASLAEGWSPVGESGELRWLPLMHLARAAASQRDAELAEKILRTIRATPEAGVEAGSALQIALAASAAWPLIDEAVSHFAETALSVAWRAKRDGCVEIEAVLGSVADRLPLGASWRLSLPRIVAELGAHARGG
ncbi:hypothetical protein [Neoroseomonas lacus]|uniref:hypothetical protein n=1 Tax=Neoroseomonas lacus TaxID=287609 RepID=UPI00166BA24E|nr:hypothetical protein [Neoroseomonas lacus]